MRTAQCEYCGGKLSEPKPGESYRNAPCLDCGAATTGVILGDYMQGLQPMFKRNWRGKVRPGLWVHPQTGEREPMTNAEFESLRQAT